jgi:hypothetical protein
MKESVLANLRIAATLAHRSSFGLRLSHEGQTVLQVGFPSGGEEPAGPRVPPCAFRVSVGEAWRLHRQGRCLNLCGLPHGEDPVIDVEVPPGAVEHPAGIYEVPLRESRLLMVATTAGLGPCRAAAGPGGLDLHVDPLLGVILLQASAVTDSDAALARDALLAAAAEVTVAELLEEAAPGLPHW